MVQCNYEVSWKNYTIKRFDWGKGATILQNNIESPLYVRKPKFTWDVVVIVMPLWYRWVDLC